ncbi:MAG: DEAD/DEAH box helicase family protein [Gammaproteobacteria bacterium]|nr:DEAD/DEAH box helicase family protein [Gammaproteobacteria bacterium]
MANPRRESLLEAIAREEALLVSLVEEQAAAEKQLEILRAELASLDPGSGSELTLPIPTKVQPTPPTPAEKVALFRGLFQGRTDVFPKLWTNNKTGKKGYSPACGNEWIPGVCDKRQVKCGECPNQTFIPVSDRVILDHLQGRHVMGVYPMLEDETCWFLAVDFDKGSWKDDITAFMETCENAGIPATIERSRSGNGAHVWFFFSALVRANIARKMGCHLLTETMARRHQLAMESYDRLFPNQDTMPRGGFGNLIALPLQHGPRQQGNTVFLDKRLVPHPDQWAYLALVQRIPPATVEYIAAEAARRGQVLGVQSGGVNEDEGSATPWTRSPSGRTRKIHITEPIPKKVKAVLAQRLFVEKQDLPSSLLNRIKRLAAFKNPEFYKKQNLRLSTALTPRLIVCAEEFPEHIALPRGCRPNLEGLLGEYGSTLIVDDKRYCGAPLQLHFHGQLTPVQNEAVQVLLADDMGVFVAPPGIGKTVVGIHVIAERACNTLVLVHRQPLLDQWKSQLALFLDIKPADIGQIGGGKRKPNGRLDVAMIQSLVHKDEVDDIVAEYAHVVVDECHHLSAKSFERVLAEVRARYVTGLTATPRRRDGQHPIIHMQLGPIRFTVAPTDQAARRPFYHHLVVRETCFKDADNAADRGIQELYGAIANDEERNRLIIDDVIGALEEGRSPIVLTERKDHLEYLEKRLSNFTRHLVVLRGGTGKRQQREVAAQMAAIPDAEERLVLATGRYIGEGFDDARLDTLFLTMPVSWRGTLTQYVGRLHRLHTDKTEVRVVDYVDREVPMLLKMYDKRMRGYRALGYLT